MFHVTFFPVNTWLVTPSLIFSLSSVSITCRSVVWRPSIHKVAITGRKGVSLLEEEARYWKHEGGSVDRWKVRQAQHACSVYCSRHMGWSFMHLYILSVCMLSPHGSGVRRPLPLASLNHVICHVNPVITCHYTQVRFQWHHSIQHPICVFTTVLRLRRK